MKEHLVPGNLARFLAITGELCEQAGFVGAVDVGVGLGNIAGASSTAALNMALGHVEPYPHERFTNTNQFTSGDLRERPGESAVKLVRTFLDGVAGMWFEPLVL